MAVKSVRVSGSVRDGRIGRRRGTIKNEVRLRLMRFSHERIARMLADNAGLFLPSNVKRDKLEEAYYKISNDYVWVLKKK